MPPDREYIEEAAAALDERADVIRRREAADAALLKRQVPDSVMLPYQLRWVSDPSPLVVGVKSRRIGLTWATAAAFALRASQADGASCYYSSYNRDMTRGFIEAVRFWAEWYGQLVSAIEQEEVWVTEERQESAYRVRFASGHVVESLPGRARAFRSKGDPGEWACIDEYAFCEEQQPLLDAAMAMLMWGGKVWVISTHFGVENAFAAFVEEVESGMRPGSVHRITLADAIADGLYRRICLVTRQEWSPELEAAWEADIRARYRDGAAEELDCIPARGEGRYLPRELMEHRMTLDAPTLRWTWEDDWTYRSDAWQRRKVEEWVTEHVTPVLDAAGPATQIAAGWDFARRVDLSCLTLWAVGGDLVRREILSIELRNMPHEAQAMLGETILKPRRLRQLAFDATGAGGYLGETLARRLGPSRVAEITLSQAWYLEWMPKFKYGLEDGLVELGRDREALDDYAAVRRIAGIPRVAERRTAGSGADRGQRHGDRAIAACLAWYASCQQPGSLAAAASAGPRRSAQPIAAPRRAYKKIYSVGGRAVKPPRGLHGASRRLLRSSR